MQKTDETMLAGVVFLVFYYDFFVRLVGNIIMLFILYEILWHVLRDSNIKKSINKRKQSVCFVETYHHTTS